MTIGLQRGKKRGVKEAGSSMVSGSKTGGRGEHWMDQDEKTPRFRRPLLVGKDWMICGAHARAGYIAESLEVRR